RQPMHPADQFEAFARLVRTGLSVEDVAARFGVTPLFVSQRLKLANVSPTLIELYREAVSAWTNWRPWRSAMIMRPRNAFGTAPTNGSDSRPLYAGHLPKPPLIPEISASYLSSRYLSPTGWGT